MAERKKKMTTLWVAPSTQGIINKKKRKGETTDQCLRRYIR